MIAFDFYMTGDMRKELMDKIDKLTNCDECSVRDDCTLVRQCPKCKHHHHVVTKCPVCERDNV